MGYQTEPVTMWFDRRLVLRRSPIHGIGTFVTQDVSAGELLVMVTGGLVFTADEWRSGQVQLEAELYNQEKLGGNLFIVTPKLFQYYINHSCAPNALDLSRDPKATQYVAARNLQADEEITADYYDQTGLEKCRCGSERCRWNQEQEGLPSDHP